MPPSPALNNYVEFYWQSHYTETGRFTIKTFPRIGSTLLFCLDTPFTLQHGSKQYKVEKTCRYLRNKIIVSCHSHDDLLFGVQLRVDFSFLRHIKREAIIDNGDKDSSMNNVWTQLKDASTMAERVHCLEAFLLNMLNDKEEYKANNVTNILSEYCNNMDIYSSLNKLNAGTFHSSKTIERHFKYCTGLSPKQAVKLIRIRRASQDYISNKKNFDYRDYGYYDNSHFHKEFNWFIHS